ncbi:MAG TPA: DUF3253 domain-containing protein [Propionibacteriaceae bacterium]
MDPAAPDSEPTATVDEDDAHYFVVKGRRWRTTDPSIPEPLRVELVAELMDARRAVRDAKGEEAATASARDRVQDAKVALGERGEPWWETASTEGRAERLAAAIRTLLRHRNPDKTICPSDAARVVGGEDWRDAMDAARAVAGVLASTGVVEVRQKGEVVDLTGAEGPIRLGRGPKWADAAPTRPSKT